MEQKSILTIQWRSNNRGSNRALQQGVKMGKGVSQGSDCRKFEFYLTPPNITSKWS